MLCFTFQVEESEDEISEMYDDFPTEFTTPVAPFTPGLYANANLVDGLESNAIEEEEEDDIFGDEVSSSSGSAKLSRNTIRHSGIDQLQAFLSLDSSGMTEHIYDIPETDLSTNNQPQSLPNYPAKPNIRGGAVSRLGHSSAIDQLQKIVRSRSDV